MAVLQYILLKFPTPGNDLWSRAWTKIQISLPPGQQDNSNALPPGQSNSYAPPPLPRGRQLDIDRCIRLTELENYVLDFEQVSVSQQCTTLYTLVRAVHPCNFSSSLCGSHANGKLCDSGGWPELRSQTIIITRARLTHWTRVYRVNIFF